MKVGELQRLDLREQESQQQLLPEGSQQRIPKESQQQGEERADEPQRWVLQE